MIRRLTESDSKDYYRVRLMGLELHPEAFATGADDWKKATDDQVKALLKNNSPNDCVLGEFDQDLLVGVIGLKREAKHSVSHKATIWGFFVNPSHQNKGSGKRLLEEVVAEAKLQAGLDYIRARVTASNVSAAKVFEVVGFYQFGSEKRGIKVDDRYHDQIDVRLDLA